MSANETRKLSLETERALAHAAREALDVGLAVLDREGRISAWNRGAEAFYGYRPGEIGGRHFSVLYPPEALERRAPQEALKAAHDAGRVEDEGWRRRKDGSRFWARVVLTALRDESGVVRGFAQATCDLTERRTNAEALRQSEERFRLLVEGLKGHAFYTLDADGRIASWNVGAERLLGFKAEEVLGRPVSMLYPPEANAAKLPEQQRAMAREHGRFEDEGTRLRKNGSSFAARVLIAPFYDEHGLLVGYAELTREFSDEKRMAALEKSEREMNEFLAVVAHELRNPLAPISNALHLLSRRPAGEPTEQWVRDVLQRQVGDMTRIVEDLLDVSRITRATITLTRQHLDVRRSVRAALEAAAPWIAARRQRLEVSLPQEPLAAEVDEVRLVQLLRNLLQDAAKSTAEGGTLELSARGDAGDVCIVLRDPALDEPHLSVGLTLVQRLVHMHGGTVETRRSAAGREVVVRLPATAGAQNPESSGEQKVAARRVLVVDDNVDAANALKLLLESEGHEVRVANDGVSGLELARSYRPEYLLLDIGLPRLSGYDIVSHVRRDPALKHCIIVAVTGYGQVHDRARTTALGFDHHLTKPVEFPALQALFRERA